MISALFAQASDVPFTSPTIDYHALAPEIVLSVVVCAVLVLDLFLEETKKWITTAVTNRPRPNPTTPQMLTSLVSR